MAETYTNEGFLYINNVPVQQEQFIKGRIIDSDNTLVCPGEIIPQLVDEYTEIIHEEIQYYSPIIKGTRVRIYYYNSYWHISTVNKIYPSTIKQDLFIEQINSDDLDIDNVYYAVITDEDIIILTYITEKNAPVLAIPDLDIDHAFKHHMAIKPFDITQEKLQEMIKKLHTHQQNRYGITLFIQNKTPIELWSKEYHVIKSMEKPDHVSIYKYYFQVLGGALPSVALAPHPRTLTRDIRTVVDGAYGGEGQVQQMAEPPVLSHGGEGAEPPAYGGEGAEPPAEPPYMYDINQFITYYPEHKKNCDRITQKIEEFALQRMNASSDDIEKQKLLNIQYLLSLDIENSLSLISPMPSRRNSII